MSRLITFTLLLSLWGCQSAYYAAWEKLGVEKRDILVDRVEDARDAQTDAQQQFASALEEFSALINFDGGELEAVYTRLRDQYQASKASAELVSSRIDKVESVAEALFEEWEAELDRYAKASMRRASERQLRDTRQRYQQLVRTMRKVENRMSPVLETLEDNVLYLKHHLNASAIGALQGELSQITLEVNRLIEEINQAIAESDRFIQSFQG